MDLFRYLTRPPVSPWGILRTGYKTRSPLKPLGNLAGQRIRVGTHLLNTY